MTMIHALRHFALEDGFQLLQVQHHAGDRVGLSGDGHFQSVIVPVAVRVVALSKDSAILLGRKSRVMVEVRGRELDFPRKKDHGVLLTSTIRELRWSTP